MSTPHERKLRRERQERYRERLRLKAAGLLPQDDPEIELETDLDQENEIPELARVPTPDLDALRESYQALFGENLPPIFETRIASQFDARTRRGYLAMPVEERARMHREVWLAIQADEALKAADPTGHAAKFYGVPREHIEWTNYRGEVVVPAGSDPRPLLAAGKLILPRVRQAESAPVAKPTTPTARRGEQMEVGGSIPAAWGDLSEFEKRD